MISRLFGRREPEPDLPRERGPLGLAIGHAVEIDTIGIVADMAGHDPAMGDPEGGSFIVAAFGEAPLDGDTILSRYYDDHHGILQVLAPPGGNEADIQDVSLYRPWDSVTPMTNAEWDRWNGPDGLIGQSEYDADGILFQRYWGDGPDKVDMVEFTEAIDDGERRREIHQMCMLYSRRVGRGEEMLLINIERDLAAASKREGGSVEFLIGYGLGPADIRKV